eukprot:scaffold1509_cov133-Chaetoceros_neogracile.AAC.6
MDDVSMWMGREGPESGMCSCDSPEAEFWDEILSCAVSANYSKVADEECLTKVEWQAALRKSNVVVQWDPDQEPLMNKKYHRRAIQLGIRPDLLKRFG